MVGLLVGFAVPLVPHLVWGNSGLGFGNVKDGAYGGMHVGFACSTTGAAAAATGVASVLALAFMFAFSLLVYRARRSLPVPMTTSPWVALGALCLWTTGLGWIGLPVS